MEMGPSGSLGRPQVRFALEDSSKVASLVSMQSAGSLDEGGVEPHPFVEKLRVPSGQAHTPTKREGAPGTSATSKDLLEGGHPPAG